MNWVVSGWFCVPNDEVSLNHLIILTSLITIIDFSTGALFLSLFHFLSSHFVIWHPFFVTMWHSLHAVCYWTLFRSRGTAARVQYRSLLAPFLKSLCYITCQNTGTIRYDRGIFFHTLPGIGPCESPVLFGSRVTSVTLN